MVRWLVLSLSLGLAPLASAQGLLVPEGTTFNVPSGGSFDLACGDLNIGGDVAVSGGAFAGVGTVAIAASGRLQGGSGNIEFGGNWLNQGQFQAGTSTVTAVDDCGATTAIFSGMTVFNNLVLRSTAGREFIFPAGSLVTVAGSLTLAGTSSHPVILSSAGAGVATIRLAPGATVQSSFAQVQSNVVIGDRPAASPVPALGAFGLPGLITLTLLLALSRLRLNRTAPLLAIRTK
ncbi:hypothetical protein [Parahaliea aestuarii]